MPRARKGAARRQRKERWFKAAKGYQGSRGKTWKRVKQAVTRAGVYAYRDRKTLKREMRGLWITRINGACSTREIRYSQLIAGLKAANILLNRKMLSEIAIADPAAFDAVVAQAKAALQQAQPQAA
jgi:large subunit ribosomal protein L20